MKPRWFSSRRAQRRSGECSIERTPRKERELERDLQESYALLQQVAIRRWYEARADAIDKRETIARCQAEAEEQRARKAQEDREWRRWIGPRELRWLATAICALLGLGLLSEIAYLIGPVSQGVATLLVFGLGGLLIWLADCQDRRVRKRTERETR